MRLFYLLLLMVMGSAAYAQADSLMNEESTGIVKEKSGIPAYKEGIVKRHKKKLHLTIIFDEIEYSNRIIPLSSKHTETLSFESSYIHVHDSLYVKLYFSRNRESGKNFYATRWKYFKKQDDQYSMLAYTYYNPIQYNADYPFVVPKASGQGIGVKGTPEYFMIYYRYKIK